MRDGDHAQDCGAGGQKYWPGPVLRGGNNGGVAFHALSEIIVDLTDQYHGIANNHPRQRDRAEQSHKSHGRIARQHGHDDPRQAERGHEQSQQHTGIAPQLEHQQ
ncbi:MAG: hypothetical protein E7G62_06540 [Klebsiella grimontii]|nr:hypothetical protein [Klebsiella grimontii]